MSIFSDMYSAGRRATFLRRYSEGKTAQAVKAIGGRAFESQAIHESLTGVRYTGVGARGGRQASVAGWGEMSAKDAFGLTAAIKAKGTVGGAGMPITTGYGGTPKGLNQVFDMFGGGALGKPPMEEEDSGGGIGTVIGLGALAYIAYRVLTSV